MKYLGKKTDNKDIATQDDFGSYVTTNTAQTVSGAKTFSSPVVVNSNETYGLEVNSTSKGGYLKVQRGTGNSAVTMAIKSGSSGGTFGTVTNHQFQFRTNDTARMVVGTDGSVVLSTDVAANSNNNQVATTKWVNSKIAPLSLYKQDLFAQTFTEDLYLEDGWIPEFESGLYYTGEHHIYINNTLVQGFDNAIIKIDTDGIDFIITRVVDNSTHYGNNFEILRASCFDSETWDIAYIHYLPTGNIRTSIPPAPSASYQNNYVPSFKLFYDQLQLKANTTDLANKQDILATTLTADIYLVDGTAPTLTDGIYYTGTHKIYVNGMEATAFRNSMFTISNDGTSTYIDKFWGTGYPYAYIYYNDDGESNAYTYSYTGWVKQTDITTTMPSNVSPSYWDKRVPSTKLFKTQLDLKVNSSSLGSLATMNSIDYTSNYITNKPTIPNGALASLDSIDYTSNYITNKPTIPTSAADVGAMPASSVITAFWTGTQAEYDALGTYSSTTLYLIHE